MQDNPSVCHIGSVPAAAGTRTPRRVLWRESGWLLVAGALLTALVLYLSYL